MARPYKRSKKQYHKKSHSTKKRKIGKCSYHLCDKNHVELFRCKHCREYFCYEHLHAKIPQTAPFRTTDPDRHLRWRQQGHPCFPYFEYTIKKEKEDTQFIVPKLTPEIEPLPESKPEPEPDSVPVPESIPEPVSDFKQVKEPILDLKPKNNIDEKINERLSVKDVNCYDCGKDLLHKKKEYFFDKDIGKQIMLCPECCSNRNKKEKKALYKDKKRKISLKNRINAKKELSINKIIIVFIIIIVLLEVVLVSGYYILDHSYTELLEEKKILVNEIINTQNKLNNSNSQLLNLEIELFQHENYLQENYSELQILRSGDKYNLHDPTWNEIEEFLNANKYNDIKNMIENLKNEGIRCAFVLVELEESSFHLIGFNTLDYGMVYIEPDSYYLVYPEIGKGYFNCVENQPYGNSNSFSHDMIEKILIIW